MDAGEALKRILPNTKIVVLTMSEDFELAADASRHWASALCLPSEEICASELAKAIRAVMKGSTYVTPRVAHRLLQEFIRDPYPDREKALTRRQREVLQLLAEGRSPGETTQLNDC